MALRTVPAWTRLIIPVSLVLALLGLAGCSSGSSSSSSTGGSTADTLTNFTAASTASVQDTSPIGDTAVNALDAQTGGTDDELLQADDITRAGTGSTSVSATVNGITIAGTFTYSLDAGKQLSLTSNVTAIGTVAGTGTAEDGVVVNLSKIGSVTNDNGTVTITGTITKGTDTYSISIVCTFTKNVSAATLHTVKTIQKNGTPIYAKDLTRSIDRTVPAPRPRTLNGTITVTDPATGNIRTVTYTALIYKPVLTGGLDYLSGSVTLTWTKSGVTTTANLIATSGQLTGNITDSSGAVIGTLTIADGKVTAVKKP